MNILRNVGEVLNGKRSKYAESINNFHEAILLILLPDGNKEDFLNKLKHIFVDTVEDVQGYHENSVNDDCIAKLMNSTNISKAYARHLLSNGEMELLAAPVTLVNDDLCPLIKSLSTALKKPVQKIGNVHAHLNYINRNKTVYYPESNLTINLPKTEIKQINFTKTKLGTLNNYR